MRTALTTFHPGRHGATPRQAAACPSDIDTHPILLGEPHPDLRTTFTLLLRRAGHHIHTACDPDAVIESAGRLQPHLIIIDLQELGAPTCRTLRTTSETATIPVILLSTTLRLDTRTAAEAGASTYLALPVDLQTLLHRVHILLQKPEWSDLPA